MLLGLLKESLSDVMIIHGLDSQDVSQAQVNVAPAPERPALRGVVLLECPLRPRLPLLVLMQPLVADPGRAQTHAAVSLVALGQLSKDLQRAVVSAFRRQRQSVLRPSVRLVERELHGVLQHSAEDAVTAYPGQGHCAQVVRDDCVTKLGAAHAKKFGCLAQDRFFPMI